MRAKFICVGLRQSLFHHLALSTSDMESILMLCFEVAFLIAVTPAKRVSELQALSVHESCYGFLHADAGVILCLNSAVML